MENLHPQIGDRVRVRQRTWRVQEVDEWAHTRVLTLAGFEADGHPCLLRVIHPVDDVTAIRVTRRMRRVGIRRWRRTCAAILQEHGGTTAMHQAAAATVDVLPFQLEPALALLGGIGTRLLIADDVGLGKTVQALLCAAELRARSLARRVLVLCPPGLREQWLDEAATRLQLPFALVDHASLARLAARLPADVNPWSIEPLAIVSVDYAKRGEVLPALATAGWDLVIVDEAHGSSGDSHRQQAVAHLASAAAFVVLLTATPHNGDEAAFSTLCATGRLDEDLVVFRRTRIEVGRDSGRRVHTLRVRPTAAERRMHAALAAFSRAMRQEQPDLNRSTWLLLSLLYKRAFSSAFALGASAARRLRWLEEGCPPAGAQLALPWDDDGGDLREADAPPSMWQAPPLADPARERQLLRHLVDAAREAERAEAKLHRLRRLLDALREPAIVFTEYRDTLQHLRARLVPDAVLVHGGLTREQRRAALDAFHDRRLLLATDAASEGLNLQAHCRVVINLELPWNPMRLEQRIGRVDRIGQARRVHAFHLVADGTGETRLLTRLTARVSRAHARVGAPNPLGGRSEWTDEAAARLVVFNEAAAPRQTPVMIPPHVALTRLVPDACEEAARLELTRALRARATATRAADTAVRTQTRRRAVRRTLLGRTLRIFRTRLVDASGRPLATHVVATRCGPDEADPDLTAHASAVAATPSHKAWVDTVLAAHRRLTAARLRRAQAIASRCTVDSDEQQPGLFDARAQRTWQARDLERRQALAVARARVEAVSAQAQPCVGAPELMLVLEPRGAGSRR